MPETMADQGRFSQCSWQPGLFGRGLGILAYRSHCLFLIVTTSKLKVFSLSSSPPHPTPTLHSLVTLQLCQEDCFSNISVKVSYQLQTPEGRRDHPQPILDFYAEPSAIFQVTQLGPDSPGSHPPKSTCSPIFKEC